MSKSMNELPAELIDSILKYLSREGKYMCYKASKVFHVLTEDDYILSVRLFDTSDADTFNTFPSPNFKIVIWDDLLAVYGRIDFIEDDDTPTYFPIPIIVFKDCPLFIGTITSEGMEKQACVLVQIGRNDYIHISSYQFLRFKTIDKIIDYVCKLDFYGDDISIVVGENYLYELGFDEKTRNVWNKINLRSDHIFMRVCYSILGREPNPSLATPLEYEVMTPDGEPGNNTIIIKQ